jgi:hypothetical protein
MLFQWHPPVCYPLIEQAKEESKQIVEELQNLDTLLDEYIKVNIT